MCFIELEWLNLFFSSPSLHEHWWRHKVFRNQQKMRKNVMISFHNFILGRAKYLSVLYVSCIPHNREQLFPPHPKPNCFFLFCFIYKSQSRNNSSMKYTKTKRVQVNYVWSNLSIWMKFWPFQRKNSSLLYGSLSVYQNNGHQSDINHFSCLFVKMGIFLFDSNCFV